jgi:hypothetical protein
MVQGYGQGAARNGLLIVRVKRCVDHPERFRYYVLEENGELVETSSHSFASEAEAIRAGNAAARAIRRQASFRALSGAALGHVGPAERRRR